MQWALKAPRVNWDDVVFHAQQFIEKLMKGILAARGCSIERTHDLNILAHVVQQIAPGWSWRSEDLAALQPGAVLLRYPGYSASEADARAAIEACERLRASLLPQGLSD
jgi:HEPN domain-containing protein